VGADAAHTVDWLMQYIRDPKSVKQNSRMPPQRGVNDTDLRALAEYLASLK
jgi:cytochrome c1